MPVNDDRMSPEMLGEDEHGRQKPSTGIAANVILAVYSNTASVTVKIT